MSYDWQPVAAISAAKDAVVEAVQRYIQGNGTVSFETVLDACKVFDAVVASPVDPNPGGENQ